MTTYLLNLTIIWLFSLLFFELFLIKEKHFAYSRIYLMLTLLAGCIVPLLSRPTSFAAGAQRPLTNLDAAKKVLVGVNSGQRTELLSWSGILTALYLAGVLLSLLYTIRECSTLIGYYKNGRRERIGKMILIETGHPHGPFSFARFLFVSAKSNYSTEEWEIVLKHERAHGTYLHLVDLIVLQTLLILLWFHPLLYLYRRRLLLIHEYQADHISSDDRYVYGNFLVEQALLQAGSSLTHSFNRSPIKNRLAMLNKQASRRGKLKFLALLPVLGSIFFCCTSAKPSYEKKFDEQKHTVTFRGNVFGLPTTIEKDTVMVDMGNGQKQMTVFEQDPYIPISMNGIPVTDADNVGTAPRLKNGADFPTLLFQKVEKQIEQLPDGDYMFNILTMIVDPSGNLVYFDMGGIYPNERTLKDPEATKIIKAINSSCERYINETNWEFLPGTKDGKPILCKTNGGFNLQRQIKVTNHKAVY